MSAYPHVMCHARFSVMTLAQVDARSERRLHHLSSSLVSISSRRVVVVVVVVVTSFPSRVGRFLTSSRRVSTVASVVVVVVRPLVVPSSSSSSLSWLSLVALATIKVHSISCVKTGTIRRGRRIENSVDSFAVDRAVRVRRPPSLLSFSLRRLHGRPPLDAAVTIVLWR